MDVRWGVKLFCLWGHSYEFDEQGNWDLIERFCETMGRREYIYYATCGEIHDYLEAAGRIRASVDGTRIENPTAATLYLSVDGENRTLAPGETMLLPAI